MPESTERKYDQTSLVGSLTPKENQRGGLTQLEEFFSAVIMKQGKKDGSKDKRRSREQRTVRIGGEEEESKDESTNIQGGAKK